jgi:PilZ domain-containing protein
MQSMLDRRQSEREKVIYGGVAEVGESGTTRDCVVRDFSERGAKIEFSSAVSHSRSQTALTIARKGRRFLARIIWWRDNFVGVAFSSQAPFEPPVSDLAERLRKSEEKKRQLQQRIKELLEG